MAGGIEGWHFFDVESGQLPDESSPSVLPGAGKGRIVVLAATPFARQDSWASRAAVLMAREWAGEGLRIFLMDLGLEVPSLHEVLGLANEEGVSDAFLFGASIQHIAKPALDNAVFFASAGAPPGDPEEVLGHPRWNDLAGGFSEAEATLLLFLPTEIPGAGKILSRATEIFFLAARGEAAEAHLGPASVKVVTTLGPLGTPSEEGTSDAGASAGSVRVAEGPFSGFPDESGQGSGDGFDELDDGSPFDFEGGLQLAEGFGMESAPEDLLPSLDGTPSPVGEGRVGDGLLDEWDRGPVEETETGYPTPRAVANAPQGPDGGATAKPSGSEFGDDLVMGTSLAEETFEVDAVRTGTPDFDAEFVDLPPIDAHPQGADERAGFGGDLVQGPDFGAPPGPGGVVGWDEPPPVEEPPLETPARLHREVPHEHPAKAERRRPPRRTPPKKKFPWGRLAVVLLVVAFLGSAVGTALGYLDVPGFSFLRDFFSEVPDPPLTLAGPQANEDVLRYSLVLFTYDDEEIEPAREMLDALQERLPDLLLTLVPGRDGGRAVHTLLAGPAVDRVEAENLRGPIAEVLTREDPASWSVRETPRAFYLGERGTLREAEDYLTSVSTGGLHAYILHVTFPDPEGSESYQVLTGAFAGVMDARPLQLMLRELGFRDAPLIERRGHLPE